MPNGKQEGDFCRSLICSVCKEKNSCEHDRALCPAHIRHCYHCNKVICEVNPERDEDDYCYDSCAFAQPCDNRLCAECVADNKATCSGCRAGGVCKDHIRKCEMCDNRVCNNCIRQCEKCDKRICDACAPGCHIDGCENVLCVNCDYTCCICNRKLCLTYLVRCTNDGCSVMMCIVPECPCTV